MRTSVFAFVLLAGASVADAFTGAPILGMRHSATAAASPRLRSAPVMQASSGSEEVSRRASLLTAFGLLLGAAVPAPAAAAGPTATFAVNTADGVKGDVVIELFADAAPQTVAAFTKYAKEGLYDGTAFHRVNKFIKKAVLVGGDPFTKEEKFCLEKIKGGSGAPACSDGDGYGKDGFFSSAKRTSADDSKKTRGLWDKGGPAGWRTDGLSEVKLEPEFALPIPAGSIVMRRFARPNSAGSQFMICLGDMNVEMGGQFAAFGKVTAGMDLLEKIAGVETYKSQAALFFPRDDKKLPVSWSAWDLPITRQGIDKITVN